MALEKPAETENVENGDAYDYDTGDYLGQLEPVASPISGEVTVEIAVWHNGKYYVYKLDRKELPHESSTGT